ncbi:hypothetical protein RI367_002483 [Sorochytrium milnesiophthora]
MTKKKLTTSQHNALADPQASGPPEPAGAHAIPEVAVPDQALNTTSASVMLNTETENQGDTTHTTPARHDTFDFVAVHSATQRHVSQAATDVVMVMDDAISSDEETVATKLPRTTGEFTKVTPRTRQIVRAEQHAMLQWVSCNVPKHLPKDKEQRDKTLRRAFAVFGAVADIKIQGDRIHVGYVAFNDAHRAVGAGEITVSSDTVICAEENNPLARDVKRCVKLTGLWAGNDHDDIVAAMTAFGVVKNASVRMGKRNKYAIVEYCNVEDASKALLARTTFVGKDMIMIWKVEDEVTDMMAQNRAKQATLAMLPYGTIDVDLLWLKKYGAVSWKVQRDTARSGLRRQALVTFETTSAMFDAKAECLKMRGETLEWRDPASRACWSCQKVEHASAQCPLKRRPTATASSFVTPSKVTVIKPGDPNCWKHNKLTTAREDNTVGKSTRLAQGQAPPPRVEPRQLCGVEAVRRAYDRIGQVADNLKAAHEKLNISTVTQAVAEADQAVRDAHTALLAHRNKIAQMQQEQVEMERIAALLQEQQKSVQAEHEQMVAACHKAQEDSDRALTRECLQNALPAELRPLADDLANIVSQVVESLVQRRQQGSSAPVAIVKDVSTQRAGGVLAGTKRNATYVTAQECDHVNGRVPTTCAPLAADLASNGDTLTESVAALSVSASAGSETLPPQIDAAHFSTSEAASTAAEQCAHRMPAAQKETEHRRTSMRIDPEDLHRFQPPAGRHVVANVGQTPTWSSCLQTYNWQDG